MAPTQPMQEMMAPMVSLARIRALRINRRVCCQHNQRCDDDDYLRQDELEQLRIRDRNHRQSPFRRPSNSGEFRAGMTRFKID